MPWSKTPVVSIVLAISNSGLLPSTAWKVSAFSCCQDYPYGPQLYIFRGSIQSLQSCSIRLQTSVTGFAYGFRCWYAGYTLIRWDFLNPSARASSARRKVRFITRSPTG